MTGTRRKDQQCSTGQRAGVFISERDPERQITRARKTALSKMIQARDLLDKAITVAEERQARLAIGA